MIAGAVPAAEGCFFVLVMSLMRWKNECGLKFLLSLLTVLQLITLGWYVVWFGYGIYTVDWYRRVCISTGHDHPTLVAMSIAQVVFYVIGILKIMIGFFFEC
jgi:hypothetical protein